MVTTHDPQLPVTPSTSSGTQETMAQVEARIIGNQRALGQNLATFRDELKAQLTDSVARVTAKVENGVERISDQVELGIGRVAGQLESSVSTVGSKLGGGIDQVRGTIDETVKSVSSTVDGAVKQVRSTLDLRAQVQERPLAMVGVAVGVGIILGQMGTPKSPSPSMVTTMGPRERGLSSPSLVGPSFATLLLSMLRPVVVNTAHAMLDQLVRQRFTAPLHDSSRDVPPTAH